CTGRREIVSDARNQTFRNSEQPNSQLKKKRRNALRFAALRVAHHITTAPSPPQHTTPRHRAYHGADFCTCDSRGTPIPLLHHGGPNDRTTLTNSQPAVSCVLASRSTVRRPSCSEQRAWR